MTDLSHEEALQLSEQSYLQPNAPGDQWVGAKKQLDKMREGIPPPVLSAMGKAMQRLKATSGLEGASLLDAGCASAYYSEIIEYYVPGWISYVGIDRSPHMIEEAHKHYPEAEVYVGDMLNIDYPPQAFDIVLCAGTVNYIYLWKKALQELARVAKRYLLLHRMQLINEPTRMKRTEAYGHPVVVVLFNEQEYNQALTAEGFTRIYHEPMTNASWTQIWERV